MGILGYFGVHRAILRALDHRRDRIQKELDDAPPSQGRGCEAGRRVSRAARQRRARGAGVVTSAKADAERIATEAKARMEDFVARRTKAAEEQDRPGGDPAIADVRAAAAEAAASAAAAIMTQSVKGRSPTT